MSSVSGQRVGKTGEAFDDADEVVGSSRQSAAARTKSASTSLTASSRVRLILVRPILDR